jgi:hypothetical protein
MRGCCRLLAEIKYPATPITTAARITPAAASQIRISVQPRSTATVSVSDDCSVSSKGSGPLASVLASPRACPSVKSPVIVACPSEMTCLIRGAESTAVSTVMATS